MLPRDRTCAAALSEPGPAINFQAVALEWWDHWLKGDGLSIEAWPALRIWERMFDEPQDRLTERNGGWLELDAPTNDTQTRLHLTATGLSGSPDNGGTRHEVPFDLAHGGDGGDTGYFGRVGGLPLVMWPGLLLLLLLLTAAVVSDDCSAAWSTRSRLCARCSSVK